MLIGDSGVGKTCLLVRFKDNTFLSGNFISTVGIDFRVSVFQLAILILQELKLYGQKCISFRLKLNWMQVLIFG